MRLPIQSKQIDRSTVSGTRFSKMKVYPSQFLRRIPTGGGGGFPAVKCQSDQGDSCDCGGGKCCFAAPNGCTCQPCLPTPDPDDWPHPDAPIVVLGAIALPSFLNQANK